MRIFLIEDNTEIAANMADFLQAQGHIVDYTTIGKNALRLLEGNECDVIILDLMLPDTDGIEICKKIRSSLLLARIPVLMLTARDTLEDKLTGFAAGADDYMVKPFSLFELEARLKALNFRRSAHGQARTLTFGDIVYNLDTLEVYRGARRISLPSVARSLLETLMRANGGTVSRTELISAIWGDTPPDADALSVHIHSLRSQLHARGEAAVLLTVRGAGYRLIHDK